MLGPSYHTHPARDKFTIAHFIGFPRHKLERPAAIWRFGKYTVQSDTNTPQTISHGFFSCFMQVSSQKFMQSCHASASRRSFIPLFLALLPLFSLDLFCSILTPSLFRESLLGSTAKRGHFRALSTISAMVLFSKYANGDFRHGQWYCGCNEEAKWHTSTKENSKGERCLFLLPIITSASDE